MKEKDTLVSQTDSQRDIALARPEDFSIVRDDDEAFHGQRSNAIQKASDAECSRKPFGGTPERNNVDRASKPHTPGIDGAEGA